MNIKSERRELIKKLANARETVRERNFTDFDNKDVARLMELYGDRGLTSVRLRERYKKILSEEQGAPEFDRSNYNKMVKTGNKNSRKPDKFLLQALEEIIVTGYCEIDSESRTYYRVKPLADNKTIKEKKDRFIENSFDEDPYERIFRDELSYVFEPVWSIYRYKQFCDDDIYPVMSEDVLRWLNEYGNLLLDQDIDFLRLLFVMLFASGYSLEQSIHYAPDKPLNISIDKISEYYEELFKIFYLPSIVQYQSSGICADVAETKKAICDLLVNADEKCPDWLRFTVCNLSEERFLAARNLYIKHVLHIRYHDQKDDDPFSKANLKPIRDLIPDIDDLLKLCR